MPEVMKPNNKDSVSVRRINTTTEDRKKHAKEFREDKEYKQKIKEERFARIEERRKGKPSGGKGGGINIEVKGE